jgi:hypothetical protein
MKRSKTVTLTILGVITAHILAGCDEKTEEAKHCVDDTDTVVDESNCGEFDAGGLEQAQDDAGKPMVDNVGHPVYVHHGGGGFIFIPHTRWYYGGGGGTVYSPGTRVSGGSYTPTPGRSYSPPSTISRGGFGSSSKGFSAGAGE